MHMGFSYHVEIYLYTYKGISVRINDILNVTCRKCFLGFVPVI